MSRAAPVFGDRTVTGVARLELPQADALHESALVFALPDPMSRAVDACRRALTIEYPPEHQLVPHLTVLYLGRMDGQQLLRLQAALSALRPVSVDLEPRGFGTFRSGDVITNIHISVAQNESLRRLHDRALSICADLGRGPQSIFVRDAYVPHISVLDRIQAPAQDFRLPGAVALPSTVVRVTDLHLIFKRLSPGID